MADVDNIVRLETGDPHTESLRASLTGSTSTYTSAKFATNINVHVTVRGTNSATYTISGNTITITGTNDDVVDITMTGLK